MSYAGDITPQQAWDLLREHPDAVLVDCRTEAEWDAVGVPDVTELGKEPVFVEWNRVGGVRNHTFVDDVKAALSARSAGSAPVVFLCRSGQRSVGAAVAATAAGLAPAYNVLDGFEGPVGPDGRRSVCGWKVLGLPWRQR